LLDDIIQTEIRNLIESGEFYDAKMKKKLLVFTSTFPRWKGDTEPPFVYELSKRLTNSFDTSILAPHYPGSKQFEIMEDLKVSRFRYFLKKYEKLACSGGMLPTIKKNKWFYLQVPFFLISEYFSLKKQIKKNRPDMIHAHWIIPQGFIAALLKKKHHIPFAVTCHGVDVFALRGKVATAIKRFTLRSADKITVVSSAMKNELLTKIDSNLDIDVIPMGVDSELFHPKKKEFAIRRKYQIDGPFLLFVGRLAEKKGVKYLINAMSDVIKKHAEAKLMIIGRGTLEKELKELTRELKLERNVIFMGAIQNNLLPAYYATADIFACPSIQTKDGDREGLPVTILEALSSGLPVITTDLEGNKDLIADNRAIYIVRQKNHKELANKIIEILNSSKLRKITKTSAIKFIKDKFDWEIISKRYRRALNEVI